MKPSSTVSMCAVAAIFACSHEQRPPSSQEAVSSRTQPLVVTPSPVRSVATTAPVRPLATTATPPVVPPEPSVSQDEPLLTPASGVATPRTGSAQLVPNAAPQDKADTAEDQASVREIRELLAADKTISPSAKLTIVARNGRVWLRGQVTTAEVTTAEERAAIERSARRAGGVVDVRNELVVME
jgi:hypothetical protein